MRKMEKKMEATTMGYIWLRALRGMWREFRAQREIFPCGTGMAAGDMCSLLALMYSHPRSTSTLQAPEP